MNNEHLMITIEKKNVLKDNMRFDHMVVKYLL